MIPGRLPDVVALVLADLRGQHPAATFTRSRQAGVARQVVVDAAPGGRETDVSERVTVLLEAFVERTNGDGHPAESYALLADVLVSLQTMFRRVTPVIGFSSVVGPRLVKDQAGFEYHEGSIVLTIAVR